MKDITSRYSGRQDNAAWLLWREREVEERAGSTPPSLRLGMTLSPPEGLTTASAWQGRLCVQGVSATDNCHISHALTVLNKVNNHRTHWETGSLHFTSFSLVLWPNQKPIIPKFGFLKNTNCQQFVASFELLVPDTSLAAQFWFREQLYCTCSTISLSRPSMKDLHSISLQTQCCTKDLRKRGDLRLAWKLYQGRSPQICTVRDSVTSQKNIFFPSILKFLKLTSLKYMC